MAALDFFDPRRIALSKEIANHPDLIALLANHPVEEFEIRLAEVASYCGIVLHGDYLPSDLDRLCEILHKKLLEKRTPLILTGIPELPPKLDS